jgi:hypothetical protein
MEIFQADNNEFQTEIRTIYKLPSLNTYKAEIDLSTCVATAFGSHQVDIRKRSIAAVLWRFLALSAPMLALTPMLNQSNLPTGQLYSRCVSCKKGF